MLYNIRRFYHPDKWRTLPRSNGSWRYLQIRSEIFYKLFPTPLGVGLFFALSFPHQSLSSPGSLICDLAVDLNLTSYVKSYVLSLKSSVFYTALLRRRCGFSPAPLASCLFRTSMEVYTPHRWSPSLPFQYPSENSIFKSRPQIYTKYFILKAYFVITLK